MDTAPTTMFCEECPHHLGGTYLAHFFSNTLGVKMCRADTDDSTPILEVRVSEGTDTKDSYWGWWNEEAQRFMFIFPRKFLVEMCFPYGTRIEEEQGLGKLLPVNVEIIGKVEI